MLEAFRGISSDGMHACHNDGDKLNNSLPNLRWDTPSENEQDKVRSGTHYLSMRTHCPRGHRYAAPNLVSNGAKHGRRSCLACAKARDFARWRGLNFSEAVADSFYEGMHFETEEASND